MLYGLAYKFGSMIHFELIAFRELCEMGSGSFFPYEYPLIPAPFFENTVFPQQIALAPLLKSNYNIMGYFWALYYTLLNYFSTTSQNHTFLIL